MRTGILFGVAPAWTTSHADPVEALRGANRSVSGRGSWAQKSLVIGQAAMSIVLLSAAALLGKSLRNLEHRPRKIRAPVGRRDAGLRRNHRREDACRISN
jgi:hypothetical protein